MKPTIEECVKYGLRFDFEGSVFPDLWYICINNEIFLTDGNENILVKHTTLEEIIHRSKLRKLIVNKDDVIKWEFNKKMNRISEESDELTSGNGFEERRVSQEIDETVTERGETCLKLVRK